MNMYRLYMCDQVKAAKKYRKTKEKMLKNYDTRHFSTKKKSTVYIYTNIYIWIYIYDNMSIFM